MSSDNPKIWIATVTYGDRTHLLEEVLDAIDSLENGAAIATVLIVDNGTPPRSRARIEAFTYSRPRVKVLRSDTNLGSAGGYSLALEAALSSDADYVWLLDDDNRPERDALTHLLSAASRTPGAALLSLRTDRPQLVSLAEGNASPSTFGRYGSFMGFSVVDVPAKIRRPTGSGESSGPHARDERILPQVPFAPYGGIFAARRSLASIGLPRKDLYLYGDDHEYTHRLTRAGTPILLVPESRLIDIDRSWHRRASTGDYFVSKHLRIEPSAETLTRLFYYTRNRAFFESRTLHPGVLYAINAAAYLALLVLLAILGSVWRGSSGPLKCYVTIARGAIAGWIGRLGKLDGA